MVIANFKNDSHPIVYGASQWNYGEVLRIQGLNLPKSVEIHFSLEKTAGQAIPRIGTTKDGVTDVVIPDSLLENEGALQDYFIFAWIYLTNATSGRTEHKLKIKVEARSKPEIPGGDDNADPFREAIEEVNSAAERAETAEQKAAEHAEQTKADAIKTGEDRTAIAEMVESVSGISEQVQAVKEYKDQAQTAATNALLSEQKSNEAKETALQAQARAESAADEAEQHALEVEGDKSEVERLATQVRQDKSSVEQTVQGFGNTAQQAIQSVNTAKTQGVNAINTAEAEAVKAVQTEGTAQTGKVTEEGEKQVKAVQAKGQEVINSIPEDFPTQMQSKLDKQQGTENAGKLLGVGTDGNVALMGGASVGEILIADYTHRGNPEFHFADFDFATGIGTTTEPHGLTTATSVLICPNDFKVTNFTKDIVTIPIEWTMENGQLQLLPVDDTHLKLIIKHTQKTIPANLEDISNKNVDITKFHFEKPISYVIRNIDSKIKTKYIKVCQIGYINYVGLYRYRRIVTTKKDGSTYVPNYINSLALSFGGNAPAKNGVLQFSTLYAEVRMDLVHYKEDIVVGARRRGQQNLVFDKVRLHNNYEEYMSTGVNEIDRIKHYETYGDDYANASNGTRIQIYALEGEHKNES